MSQRSFYKRAQKALRERVRRLRLRMTQGGADILRVHDTVEGQLHFKESVWLYRAGRAAAARAAADGRVATIVEIGSFRGRSTVLLTLGSAPEAVVHAIDPHLDYEKDADTPPAPGSKHAKHYGDDDRRAFEANMLRFGIASRVRKIQMLSNDALAVYREPGRPNAGPIDLLWVDGDHHYEAVRDDLNNWGPLVRRGGVVACHDYTHWAGVRNAWAETIGANPSLWRIQSPCQSIVWATKLA
jgi:predicted O-methyltransferase YrrM